MSKPWQVTLLTIFPEMFPGPLKDSIAGNALEEGKWGLSTVNIRDFAKDKHKTVDDKPFGGGAGMVMRPDVLGEAIDSIKGNVGKLIYMSPRGKPLKQEKVDELTEESHIGILCGRYEGIDQRVIEEYDIEEVSIGDYVLSGGEIPALVLIDACVRKLSGVIGNAATLDEESFASGLLEYPHYTRPAEWRKREVPDVLVSGDHSKIEKWRTCKSERLTKERRKDLWDKYKNNRG